MASMTERLVAGMRLGLLEKSNELKNRLLFTFLSILVYRIGTYLPLAGVDISALSAAFLKNNQGFIGLFNIFSGGAISRMALFTLGIMPYVSASIVVQLLTSVVPSWELLRKEGLRGRRRLNQYTRTLTIFIATLQSYGIAINIQSYPDVVINPGFVFICTSMFTLIGGSLFLMWLGEQITARGIGNGVSLIIFSGIVSELPSVFLNTLELGKQGSISSLTVFFVFFLAVSSIAFIVFIERAQRRLLVQYPRRQIGRDLLQESSSHLPIRINSSGVLPPIFASAVLMIPGTLASFWGDLGYWDSYLMILLAPGGVFYMLFYAFLILFFCFFYTAVIFNANEIADNLKKQGGFIAGIRPGEKTAFYIDYVLTRITFLGAFYITFVCLLPELMIKWTGVPFYLGGTSLLIVVTVVMDIVAQIQGYLLSSQYDKLVVGNESNYRPRRTWR